MTGESPEARVNELLLARCFISDMCLELIVTNALKDEAKEPDGGTYIVKPDQWTT